MQRFFVKLVDYWRLGLILGLLLLVGWWRYEVLSESLIVPGQLPPEISGVIVADPDVRADRTFLTIRTKEFKTAVLVSVARYPEWQYGDEVKIKGKLEQPKTFITDTGRLFDYPHYLAARGIGLVMAYGQVSLIARQNSFWSYLFAGKHAFTGAINQAIAEPEAALGNGITVGEKQALPKSIQKAFQITSLSHIVVLSGYNINVVGNLLGQLGQTVGIIGIIIFGFMVGGGASVWRAIIMAIIGLVGQKLGRSYDAWRALLAAALLMSAYNPYWPLYDVSFQLSFLATAGVLLGTPWWEKRLSRVSARFGLRQTLAVTLGAQTAVLPVLLYTSGIVSLVSLPANVLVVPLVPFAMILVAVVGFVGLVWSLPALLFGYITSWLLWFMLQMPVALAALPGAFLVLPNFSGWWVVLFYLSWASVLLYRHHARQII